MGEDKEFVIAVVTQQGSHLIDVADHFKDNKDVVLAALKKRDFAARGYLLEYVSENLKGDKFKNDKKVVLAAVQQYGIAIEYVGQTLREDEDFMKELEALDTCFDMF